MIALIQKLFHIAEHRSHTRSDRMELKKRLRKAREDAKLGVNDVADYLGVGRAQVWRMEKKNADFIPVGRLKKLAVCYGRPVSYFFDDNLEIDDTKVSYQLIGMAISATESVASKLPTRPSPEALQSATLAVIRTQQARWADDPNRRFNPDEFVVLIEQYFRESDMT